MVVKIYGIIKTPDPTSETQTCTGYITKRLYFLSAQTFLWPDDWQTAEKL